jgi:riboflavin biosynthesis pyrimidine reductase
MRLKDYDGMVFYHLAKANIVADALSQKICDDEIDLDELMDQLSHNFCIVQINKVMTGGPPIMAALVVEPQSLDRIKCAKEDDLKDRARHG